MKISDLRVISYDALENAALCSVGKTNGLERFCIRRFGACLNRDGEWEYEPLPSSRSDEFLERTRFDSAQEALDCLTKSRAAQLHAVQGGGL